MIVIDGEELSLAPADERHHNYIRSSWVKETILLTKRLGVPKRLIAHGVGRIIDTMLPYAHVVASEQAPATAHGWICGIKGALFFVYVPVQLRHKGIARYMIQAICRGET